MSERITRPVKPNIPSMCVFAFRKMKQDDICTEEGMAPDDEVVMLFKKHNVRVQDLLDVLADDTQPIPLNISEMLNDYDQLRRERGDMEPGYVAEPVPEHLEREG